MKREKEWRDMAPAHESTAPTGDLREAAQKLVSILVTQRHSDQCQLGGDCIVCDAMCHVNTALAAPPPEPIDGGREDEDFAPQPTTVSSYLDLMRSPPPEPIEGPWEAYGGTSEKSYWYAGRINIADGSPPPFNHAEHGPFTESQARRVARALNEDEAEASNQKEAQDG